MIQVLISRVGLEDVLSQTIALIDIEEVVVVDGGRAEIVLWRFL